MLLIEVVVLLAVACATLVLGRALRVPPIAAYLIGGVLAGPGGIGLVDHSEWLEYLSELGVALLLFGVGTEVSLERLRDGMLRTLGGGAAQVLGSIAAGAGIFAMLGSSTASSTVVGFLVSLSSTALVFKMFADARELSTPHGRAATGILIFQDFALIPMMLFLPVLAGPAEGAAMSAAMAVTRAIAAVSAIVVLARVILPRVLEYAARLGIAELHAPLALLIALGTATAAQGFGLSLPLGGFLAGLALSGTVHAQRVVAELLPLRDAFIAVFFTSIGMLCVPAQALADPASLAGMAAAVAAKGLVCAAVVAVAWRSWRLGMAAGVALMQIGEFSFVLAREAVRLELLPRTTEQAFLATAVLSMALTPVLMAATRRLLSLDLDRGATREARLRHHVIVVGCGSTGRAVANVLRDTSIPFIVVDFDSRLVRQAEREGLPVMFGDATRRAVLEEAGVKSARVVVVSVGEPVATRRSVGLARQLNPRAPILVRASRVEEIPELEQIGATDVVPAEFEASIELFVRMLMRLGVSRHVARVQESIIRLGNYRALRGTLGSSHFMAEIEKLIRGGVIEHTEVTADSPAVGKTLFELDVREKTGAVVLTIVRNEEPIPNPGPEVTLQAGDLVVLYGPHAAIASALDILEPPPDQP
ncbi:MAG TPA: cation:proton antiporter [Candidatus Limnocylindrales bacterium]|nr:cation:proton antiporter [Candidatus Limnocylindrales bacterium]